MKTYCIVLALTTGWTSAAALGNTFFLVDNLTDQLLVGNVANPEAATPVGGLSSGNWFDLATGAALGEVFAVEGDSQTIFRLDTSNASVLSQATADRDVRTIAYDPDTATLYGLPQSGAQELFTIDPATGDTTVIGLTGISEAPLDTFGFGFDLDTGDLYVTTDNSLYAIDPGNANTVLVGSLPHLPGQNYFFGIAYNFTDGELYATEVITDSLYIVDRTNANMTLVGGPYLDSRFATGLAFQVPEPATLSLLALGGFMLTRRWRRRTQPNPPLRLPGDGNPSGRMRPTLYI